MKAIATALVLLFASSAFAQQEPKADYSRPTLMRIVVEAERERRALRFEDDSVVFDALGTRFRFTPIMLPFVGTRFTTTKEWPDAFSLLNVPYATRPGTWRARRQYAAELKRIDRLSKRAKIKVKATID